jgi:hypothetical protein
MEDKPTRRTRCNRALADRRWSSGCAWDAWWAPSRASRVVFPWQGQMVLCVHGKKVAQAIRGWTCKHPCLLFRTSFGVSPDSPWGAPGPRKAPQCLDFDHSKAKSHRCPGGRSAISETHKKNIGHWLLASGYWLLAVGYWLLAIGYQPRQASHPRR